MVRDSDPEHPPRRIALPRKQILPKMPGKQAGDRIQQAGEDQHPCGLKVEIPAPAVLVRQHVPISGRHQVPRGRDGQLEQGLRQHIAGLAPIEARVRDHNFRSADQERKKTNGSDPVSNPDKGRVPRNHRRSHNGSRDGRGRTRHASGIAHAEILPRAGTLRREEP